MHETKSLEKSNLLKHEGSPKFVKVLQQYKLSFICCQSELVGLENKDSGLCHQKNESPFGLYWCF